MKNLISLNRSGMSPEVTCRKGRHAIESIVSRFSLVSLICLCMLTVGVGNAWGAVNNGDLFERISAAPAANDEVIIVNSGETVAMSTTQNSNNRGQTSISTSSNQYIYASTDNVQVLTVSINSSKYSFYTVNGSSTGYLQSPSDNNYLRTNATLDNKTKWTISVSSNVFTILNASQTSRYIAYNSGSSIFSAYKSGQSKPYMYKKVMSAPTAVAASSITSSGATITITDATNVNNYELYYSKSNTAPNAGTTASTTITSGKSKALTGLDASSTYYLWARAYSTSPARKTGWVALTGTTFTTEASGCTNTITISKGSESHGTFTLNKSGSQMTCDGLSIIVTPSAADHYHVGSVSASTGETGVDNGNGTWTVTYAANVTGASTINVVFAEDTKYTLNYHDGSGNGSRSNIYEGTNLITALGSPAASCDPTSTTFVGWSTTEITTKTNTPPTFVAANAVVNSTTAAATYYAVYAKVNSGYWSITEIDNINGGTGYAAYNGSHTAGGESYTSSNVMQNSGIQFKTNAGYMYNTTAIDYDITSIVITSTSANWSVYTASSEISTTPGSGAITISSDGNTRTFTVSATGHTYFHIKGGASTPVASSIRVNYETAEDYITTCAACTSEPTVETPSLDGSFSLNNVPLTCTADPTTGCSISASGFVWKAGSAPSSSDNSTAGTYDAGAITGTIPSAGTFAADGTTYYIKAWATNSQGTTYSSSSFLLTPRSVTFDLNDHGSSTPSTQYVNNGGKATDPSYSESVAGWTFGGWYDNEGCTGSAWNFSSNTVSGANVTLYAKWTEKPKYTITLNAGNGTISDVNWTNTSGSTYTRTQSNGDEAITLPTPSCGCAGWVFKGWSTTSKDNAGSFTPDKEDGATFTPASNVTYYAVYRQSTPSGTTYTKITDEAALTTGDYLIVAYSSYYYAMGNSITSGHMTETSSSNATSWSNPSATLVWTIIKAGDKVGFYNANANKFLTIVDGAWVLDATDGQKFSYSFNSSTKAWTFTSPSGKQMRYASYYYVGDEQSSPIYLYKRGNAESGNYYTNPSCSDYSVTGVANPAAGGTVQLTAAAAKSGDKVWACYTADPEYDFTSWSISGTGVSPTSATTQFVAITVGSGDVTAQANFAAKVMYNVTWKAKGETLTGDDLGSASVRVENGHNITALPPVPTSCETGDGKSDQFIGWVVDAQNWSGKTNDLTSITIYKKLSEFPAVTGDVTYHAVWAAIDETTNEWVKVTSVDGLSDGDVVAIIRVDEAYYLPNAESDPAPAVAAVTKTGDDIDFVNAMKFTASYDNESDGFRFESVSSSGKYLWAYNDNKGIYIKATNGSKSGATNIWWLEDYDEENETSTGYGIVLYCNTYVSSNNFRYLATYGTTDWRCYGAVTASNLPANVYVYAYGHKNYMTRCCTDPELAFGQTRYSLIREDLHGNTSAAYSTIELTYSSESSGEIRVWNQYDEDDNPEHSTKTAWQYTGANTWGTSPTTGGTAATAGTHAYFAITDAENGKATFYVKNATASNGRGTYRVALHQAADATHCETVTYCWIDVTLRDKFVDAVNGNTFPNADAHGPGEPAVTTPAESTRDAAKDDDCHETTRRLVGWVKETDMDTWYGSSSDRTRDLDDKKDEAELVAPGATITTSGATWYAVWGIEE